MVLVLACAYARAALPELSVSPALALGGPLEVGQPLLIDVRVDMPLSKEAPVPLETAATPWIAAVTVELLDERGEIVARGRTVGDAGPLESAKIDPDVGLGGRWMLPAQGRAGKFEVRAVLRLTSNRDVTATTRFDLTVPASDADSVVRRALRAAAAAVAEQNTVEATRVLNEALSAYPNMVPLLVARAELALSVGDRLAAAFCVRRVQFLAVPAGQKPSTAAMALIERLRALRQDAIAQAADAPVIESPPNLPAAVLAPVRREVVSKPLDNRAPTEALRRGTNVSGAALISNRAASAPAPSPAPAVVAAAPLAPDGPAVGELVRDAPAEEAILSAVNAQWASDATASSSYGKTQYGPRQATGAPNIRVAGDSPDAWSAGKKNEGTDWLEVSFANPVRASEVRVRQSNAPGAISRVEAIDAEGRAHLWWSGRDPRAANPVRDFVWFVVRVPKTAYAVTRVRITFDLSAVPGWKQIDAVQLVE